MSLVLIEKSRAVRSGLFLLSKIKTNGFANSLVVQEQSKERRNL
jgi:hypothetical protein